MDQGDRTDFIWVFHNAGRVDHHDLNLAGYEFPNLVSLPPGRNMADYLTKGEAGSMTFTSKV